MGAAYEDNFGFWDLDEPEELAFFHHVQRQSVGAVCKRCERIVHLMPPRNFLRPLRLGARMRRATLNK